MASRKKTRVFQNYAEALARTEELAASGDQESDEFQSAAEAAAQFFLQENGGSRFNGTRKRTPTLYQDANGRKWLTIIGLLQVES